MKKFVSLLLCLVMLLTLSLVQVSAADEVFNVENGILYSYSGSDENVILPDDVYYIADGAFSGNTEIVSADLTNVRIIGNKAFDGCTSLDTLKNSDNVTSVGAYAFRNTKFSENSTGNIVVGSVLVKGVADSGKYTVSSGVTALAPYCFAGNSQLTGVTVPDGVTEIGEGAFYNCAHLSSVSVSKNVSHIGAFAFEETKWLSSQASDFVILGNGILIDYQGDDTEVILPESVLQVGAGAFYNNKTIRDITMSDNVTAIGMRAFAGCTALKKALLPLSLVLLDKEAFSGCTSLKEAVIPSSVTLVGESVYLGCASLVTAEYYSDADIPAGLFANCTALEGVIISSKLQKIGDYAFLSCENLSEMSVPDSVRLVSTTALKGAGELSVYANQGTQAFALFENMYIDVYQLGDADCDSKFNIKDATYIQKAAADMVTLTFNNRLRSDLDFNGVVNVRDATRVQKILAGL